MVKNLLIRQFTTLLLALCTSFAMANTVITLKNGDRISGSLIEKTDDHITIKTRYAGKLKIKWGEVGALTVNEPHLILLSNGKTEKSTIRAGSGNSVQTTRTDGQTHTLSQLKRIATHKTRHLVYPALYRFSGHVKLAGSKSEGNTNTESLAVDIELKYFNKFNRHTLGVTSNKTNENNQDTLDNTRLKYQYDRFFSDKLYGYFQASIYEDQFKDIDQQVTSGIGFGYQVWDTKRKKLSLEAGVNHVDEKLIVQSDKTYSAFRWGVNYEQKLTSHKLRLFHKHDGLADLERSKNLLITSQTGIRIPINSHLDANLQVNVDWDGEPSAGKEKTDVIYLFGIRYNW